VTELVFRADLYSGRAVDLAVKVFAPFASFDLEETTDAWVVRVEAKPPHDEQAICNELSNYALGATIEERG
jgi:hypothetical protein